MGFWEPVLDGPLAERAWQVIEHVAAALRDPPAPYDGRIEDDRLRAGLFAREAGFAVFYSYLARAGGDDSLRELAAEHLERALDRVDAIATDRPYFAFGFSGTGWALEHLGPDLHGGDDSGDADDPLASIDEALAELVEAQPAGAAFMLNTGFVGYGAYALERMPRPTARRCLAAVCDKLVAAAEPAGAGRCWRIRGAWMVSPDGEPEDQRHTGITSGTAGPLAILGAAARWGVRSRAAAEAIERGIDWLWQQRVDGRLPAVAGGIDPADGYAHGAAATAAALIASARGVASDTALERALEIGRAAAAGASRGGKDPSLVSGTAGTALALLRLFFATGEPEFRDAARRCIEVLLGAYDPSIALGGYSFFIPEWERRYLESIPTGDRELPGISLGVAGIALVLLAAITPIEPEWDRMFLLSARDPGGAT